MQPPGPLDFMTNEELVDELVRRQEVTDAPFFIFIEEDESPGEGTFWSHMHPDELTELKEMYDAVYYDGEIEEGEEDEQPF